MSHTKRIERKIPGCMLFLIDQSGSMEEPLAGAGGKRKADAVSDAINKFLKELVNRCTKDEGIRDYFDVGVIGYGAQGAGPAFSGGLAGHSLVPISQAGEHPARVEERMRKEDDGAGGLVETKIRFAVWFDPVAAGGTPMCNAFEQAHRVLEGWVQTHPESFPPIVINITDGMATDGDPTAAAQRLMDLSTQDGAVLVFNCHISSVEGQPVMFPDSAMGLSDEFARMLFNISSIIPPSLREAAAASDITMEDKARCFAFNADVVGLITFLNIGTLPATKQLDLDR